MKNKLLTLTATAGLLVTAGTASAATLINEYPTGSTSNIGVTRSTAINGHNEAKLTLTTNNNGGTVDFVPGVLNDPSDGTLSSGTQLSWRSTAADAATTAQDWIQWDLGASYTLAQIQVWNYNDSSRAESGIRQLDIYVSDALNPGDPEGAGAANWTLWAADAILTGGTGLSTYTGFDLATVVTTESFALNTVQTRYVRFEADSTFFGDGVDIGNFGSSSHNTSLGQIEFYAVPEPSSALLGGLGLLALLRRRRA